MINYEVKLDFYKIFYLPLPLPLPLVGGIFALPAGCSDIKNKYNHFK
jgi:hypothetical protein